MTAYYRRIKPLNEPSDELGLDTKNRRRWSFNITIEKLANTAHTVEEDIAFLLEDAGLGTRGTDILAGRGAAVPDGDGPYLQVLMAPGAGPEMIQNQDAPHTKRPNAQIVCRAKTHAAARTRIAAAYNALAVVKNETVTPT